MLQKTYELQHSPLFKLSSKKKLCSILDTDYKSVIGFLKSENYSEWTNKKGRVITAPCLAFKPLLKQACKLFSRIKKPIFLFSGKKGVSYIDNCKHHQDSDYVVNIDITKFYPSCKREHIFRAFKDDFLMSEDVAWLLTDILSYKNCLPTGSPASQQVAFFAYRKMFDEIKSLADKMNLKFTLYVDDISFSSASPISKNLPYECKKIFKKYGHSINDKKTKFYFKKDHKIITGCVSSPEKVLKIKNKLMMEITSLYKELKMEFKMNPDSVTKENKKFKTLQGKVNSATQIEKNAFPSIKLFLKRVAEK